MTLQQASKVLAISKKRLWRAVKAGQLDASRVQRGGRWEYRVNDEQLEDYRRKYLDSLEMKAVSWSQPEAVPTAQRSVSPLGRLVSTPERSTPERSVPQSGLHQALVERLAQAERRIVELEHELAERDKDAIQVNHAKAIIKEATRREEQLAQLAGVLQQLQAEFSSCRARSSRDLTSPRNLP